jgi:hypothetical protein
MVYILQHFKQLEDSMGYKKMRNSLGFADLALASSLKHNRSLELMNKRKCPINPIFSRQKNQAW